MRLILASQSPRRREILESAGFDVVVRPSSVPEERLPEESPEAYVRRLACDKARAISAEPRAIVLGADTVVVVDNVVLEKPLDDVDAARMLRSLSGRTHEVLTGVCILQDGQEMVDVSRTEVEFLPLSDDEISDYIRSGEHKDKAGAYGIQGLASKFVCRIDGCYFNVVGLPISLVYRWLRRTTDSARGSVK
jgi:septum formation protein